MTAKPRIGPVPKLKRNAAEMSAATCVSTSVQNTRLKPALIEARDAAPGLELLLDALEDEHVRVDADAHRQHEARDAGQRHDRADVRHQPEEDDQVEDERDDGVDAGELVVDEHEHDDQRSGRRARLRRRSGSSRRRGSGRSSRLREVVELGRKCARPQDERQSAHFLVREAAGDPPVGGDPPVDARRRLHAAVEDDRELPADVLARSRCRTCRPPSLLSVKLTAG